MRIMTGREYVGFIDPWTDEERLTDEEIVRCRDCKHYEGVLCTNGFIDGNPDAFFSWGERRDV